MKALVADAPMLSHLQSSPPRDPTAQAVVTCEGCGGNGWVVGVRPTCCGNVTRHGDCRAHCAVPEQVQEPCPECGGAGQFPLPEAP